MRSRRAAAVGAVLLGAAAAHAQVGSFAQAPGQAALERELAQRRQDLVGRAAEAERWMDLLIGHHLGLAVDLDAACALTEAERARPRGELERELASQLDGVARATAELERRSADLEQLRAAIADRPPPPPPPWQPAHVPTERAPPIELTPPAPKAPQEPSEETTEEPPPGPPPVLIRGAADRVHRGIAFFMAGSYAKAVAELEQAAAGDEPPLVALFYLARAHEKLGQVARADGLYLQIEALDGARGAGGSWTAAARTARQHMNWMRDHGVWRLPAIPEGKEP